LVLIDPTQIRKETMSTIIDAGSAKLAGLQIDTLSKYRTGILSLEHWDRFVNLTPEEREIRFGDLKGSESKVSISPIVIVSRLIYPVYPGWAKLVLHPELENKGPAGFDVTRLVLWLHDYQKNELPSGGVIYEQLKKTDTLKTCLGLRDLEEIKKKGIAFFKKYLKGKTIFAWKSVVLNNYSLKIVPCIYECGSKVIIDWRTLGSSWNSNDPAARFEN
jgi:hypothetical protein